MSGMSLRGRMWQRKVPPVARRSKLWIVRGRLHQGTGYYSPFGRVGLPTGRKPYLHKPIHWAADRAALLDYFA